MEMRRAYDSAQQKCEYSDVNVTTNNAAFTPQVSCKRVESLVLSAVITRAGGQGTRLSLYHLVSLLLFEFNAIQLRKGMKEFPKEDHPLRREISPNR